MTKGKTVPAVHELQDSLPGPRVVLRDGAPIRLESGAELGPVHVAYQTWGTLNAERSNTILICHALTGDQYAVGEHPITGKSGWWELMVGPGKPIDTDRFFVICTNCLGGCMGTTGPAAVNPADRRALRHRVPGHHDPRHGRCSGPAAGTARHREDHVRDRRLDGRHAGAGVGRALSGAGRQRGLDRRRGAPFGPEHRVPRGRPPGDHGRSRLVRRDLLPRGQAARVRAFGRAHGGPHHLSLGARPVAQVRPRPAGPLQPSPTASTPISRSRATCATRAPASSSASTPTPISTSPGRWTTSTWRPTTTATWRAPGRARTTRFLLVSFTSDWLFPTSGEQGGGARAEPRRRQRQLRRDRERQGPRRLPARRAGPVRRRSAASSTASRSAATPSGAS